MRKIYGINPVSEAMKAAGKGGSAFTVSTVYVAEGRVDKAAVSIMKTAGALGIEVRRASRREIEKLAGTDRHQGVVAVMTGEFSYRVIEELIDAWKKSGERAFFLILDSVQDPQNLGSLIRTANAAGVTGLVIPKDRAAEVTPTVVKTSAGATEHTLIARETNLARAITVLKEAGVWVVGIEADADMDIYSAELDCDIAMVVGSEGRGIRQLVRKSCDFCVSIPMAGEVNSLNAAQAGAIALFEARRQRLASKGR